MACCASAAVAAAFGCYSTFCDEIGIVGCVVGRLGLWTRRIYVWQCNLNAKAFAFSTYIDSTSSLGAVAESNVSFKSILKSQTLEGANTLQCTLWSRSFYQFNCYLHLRVNICSHSFKLSLFAWRRKQTVFCCFSKVTPKMAVGR